MLKKSTNLRLQKYILDNGLLVVLQRTPTKTVSAQLRIFHGALNEAKGEEGIAHFLEHVLFSGGTQKYSPEEQKAISSEFKQLNAYTMLDRTFFLLKSCLSEDLEMFLDYVSQTAFYPRFDAAIIEQERKIVLRELSDKMSSPDFEDLREYDKRVFGKNSPHIYFILGKNKSLGQCGQETLRSFHEQGYCASNSELILVGGLPRNIDELIQKYFLGVRAGSAESRVFLPRNHDIRKSAVLHKPAPDLINKRRPAKSSAGFSLMAKAPVYMDHDYSDYVSTAVLTNVLGIGEDSYLFRELREKQGLCYSVIAGSNGNSNKGLLYVDGKFDAANLDKAVHLVFQQFQRLQDEKISQEHLNRIKKNMRLLCAQLMESNLGRNSLISDQIEYDISINYVLKKIDMVTAGDVQNAARKYLPSGMGSGPNYVILIRDPLGCAG